VIQFHSTIVSEPVAHLSGLLVGLVTYALVHAVGASSDVSFMFGGTASVFVNLILGAKINIFLLDFMALLVVRPISAILAVKFLAAVLSQ
jgi:hypothetical protein